MNCQDVKPMVPGYLDGELSEAQAGPLRRHLLECSACRGVAQEERGLKQWFVDEGTPVTVPRDFAARVVRRAFAGDTGERFEESAVARASGEHGRVLDFVLQLTALAAALLLVLSIGVRNIEGTPRGEVQADHASLESVLEELDRLNAVEEAIDAEPASRHLDQR